MEEKKKVNLLDLEANNYDIVIEDETELDIQIADLHNKRVLIRNCRIINRKFVNPGMMSIKEITWDRCVFKNVTLFNLSAEKVNYHDCRMDSMLVQHNTSDAVTVKDTKITHVEYDNVSAGRLVVVNSIVEEAYLDDETCFRFTEAYDSLFYKCTFRLPADYINNMMISDCSYCQCTCGMHQKGTDNIICLSGSGVDAPPLVFVPAIDKVFDSQTLCGVSLDEWGEQLEQQLEEDPGNFYIGEYKVIEKFFRKLLEYTMTHD